MTRSFDDLVNEAVAADVEGWDFSWLNGRATEERPSWGYAKMMAKRMAAATAALAVTRSTSGGTRSPGYCDRAARISPRRSVPAAWAS